MITLWSRYYYYLNLTNNKTEAQKGDLPKVTQLVKLWWLASGQTASQDLIQKSGFRVRSLKVSLSRSSRCLRLATRDKHSDEETSKCPSISLATSFLLPWPRQIQPPAGISSLPGFCLTDPARCNPHFKYIWETQWIPESNFKFQYNKNCTVTPTGKTCYYNTEETKEKEGCRSFKWENVVPTGTGSKDVGIYEAEGKSHWLKVAGKLGRYMLTALPEALVLPDRQNPACRNAAHHLKCLLN